jgi:ABC-type nickel/cobalt efflux system permease component RcnA
MAFVLGIKHAIEPDHIVAISTIVCKTRKISKAAILGVLWGIGHTATLFITGMIGIMMKYTIPEKLAVLLERGVGVMIMILAINLLLNYKKPLYAHTHEHEHMHSHNHFHKHSHVYGDQHTHEHEHANNDRSKRKILDYIKSLLVGFVHGLAGSAVMILLTLTTVKSYWEGALFIIIFGVGTIISMLVYTTILGIPFALNHNNRVHNYINIIIGSVGIIFSFYYIFH